jgi:hypothetical protein
VKELLRLFSGSAIYTGCRYILGIFILIKIDGYQEKEYLSYTFIHANNQLFITLFINILLVPLIERMKINYFLFAGVLVIFSITSLIWPMVYGLELNLALLGMVVCTTLSLYELTRRIIFSTAMNELTRFDVFLSIGSLVIGTTVFMTTESALLSILSFNLTTLILCLKYSGKIFLFF